MPDFLIPFCPITPTVRFLKSVKVFLGAAAVANLVSGLGGIGLGLEPKPPGWEVTYYVKHRHTYYVKHRHTYSVKHRHT